jgi:hypothetical protein
MSVCYRDRVRCQTSGCRHPAVVLCRYPVTRNGRAGTCSRQVCDRCAGADRYCPPHARIAGESLVKICAACYSSSCAHGELPCAKPGTARTVTIAQWKTLLSFGVL